MNEQLTSMLDRLGPMTLTLLIQVTLILLCGLLFCWFFRRRPSAQHFVALSTVALVALCPLFVCLPVSPWCVIPVDLAATQIESQASEAATSTDVDLAIDHDATLQSISVDENVIPAALPVNPQNIKVASSADELPRSSKVLVEPSIKELSIDVSLAPSTRRSHETANAQAVLEPDRHQLPVLGEQSESVSATFDVPAIARKVLHVFILAWLVGAVVLTLRFVWHLWRLRKLVTTCEQASTSTLDEALCRVVKELRLVQTPVVLASKSLSTPIVTGIRHPKIILPLSLFQQSSADEFHIVLSHECAHIARRDLWVSLFQRLLAIVYWPHIFVHVLNRHLSLAREELCDNHVLSVTDPTTYAKTLLRIGEGATGTPAIATSLPWIGKHWSLEDRVSKLLDPKRRTETRVSRGIAFTLVIALSVVVTGAAGIAVGNKTEDKQASTEGTNVDDPAELIKAMAERASYWTTPASPDLKTLEYTYLLGHNPQNITLKKGSSNVRYSVWQACSLRTGIHTLLREPDRFDTEVELNDDESVTISAKLASDDSKNVGIEVGNGINGSWRGYYSHSTREVVLTVDRKRLVPLEEKCGATTVRYSEWNEVAADRWVPGTIDVSKGQTRYRMHFEWAGDAVWLLTYAEAISRDGAETIARTTDVKVNDVATMRELTAKEKSQDKQLAIVQRMLSKNDAWLNPKAAQFDSIEYTFHTVREDIREQGYLNRDGTAILEVVHDGQGKMGDRLGARRIALPTQEVAYTHRDARFAKLTPRPTRLKNQPADEQYRHYVRIGCQLDLPLFRYHERLELAQLDIQDGEWNGKPCDIAKVKGLGRDVYFGAGTMFGFTSWSYVHHIRPVHELIYIDKETHLPIHESFVGSEPNRSFEIDFDDYVEVTDGQWVPLSIRTESKDYFTAEYKFQIVQGKHWMLKEVVSWFDVANKSRGVVENIQVNENSDLYSAAMTQVNASRKLFTDQGSNQQVAVTPIPIVFGKRTEAGKYNATLTVTSVWSAAIRIETNDVDAPSKVPVLLLNKDQQLLFATNVALSTDGDVKRGEAGLGGSHVLGQIHSIALPGVSRSPNSKATVATSDVSWNTPMTMNVSDVAEKATRAYELLLTRDDDGTANAKLTVASHKGPAKFLLDLSVVLFDDRDQVIAAGMHNGSMLVKSGIVEEQFDIPLGSIADADKATKAAIAVTVGDVTSAPMGSTWGMFMRDGLAIPLEQLLSADDEACRKQGLQQLSGKIRLDKEFFDDQRNRDRLEERGESRNKLLAPHVTNIANIVQQTSDEVVLLEALRLLGHAGNNQHVNVAKRHLNHSNNDVADKAAIATAMLGDASGFDRLRSIFERRVPSWESERDERRGFDRLETDAVIALASVSDARSINLLGDILQGDLNSLGVATHEKGHQYLTGRQDRIKRVIQVLGYCENEAAVPPLLNAVEFFDEHPKIAEIFVQLPLVEALMQYEDSTREVISKQISKGNYAYIRAFKLNVNRNAYYVSAVHEMLLHPDTSSWTAWQGVRYLWNVGNPAAVDVLRDAYDKEIHKDDLRTRFAICEALASFGDHRGVSDAFEALTELYSMETPPTDKAKLKVWEDRREDLEKGAEDLFTRVPQETLNKLIQSKLDTGNPSQRRAVVESLWYLAKTPASVIPTLKTWQADANDPLTTELAKLLNRE